MDFDVDVLPLITATLNGIEINSKSITSEITSPVFLSNAKYKNPWIIFKGITFNNYVSISGDLSIGIGFVDCQFYGIVKFENIICNGKEEVFNSESKSVFFTGCEFNKSLLITGDKTKVEKNFAIENCQIKDGIVVDKILVQQTFYFENCYINKKADFNDLRINNGLKISSTEFDCVVRIEGGAFSNIALLQSVFNKELKFWSCKIKEYITFNDGVYGEDVMLKTIQDSNNASLNIIGGNFKNSCNVFYQDPSNSKIIGGFKFLYFRSCEFFNGLNVKGTLLVSEMLLISELELKVSAKMQGDILFSDLHIGELKVSGINSNAKIKFYSLFVNTFLIEDFYNHAQFMVTGIRPSYETWIKEETLSDKNIVKTEVESSITLIDSNFGKAEFLTIDFKSFKSVRIRHVNIIESYFSSISWFDDESLRVVGNFTDEHVKNAKKKYKNKVPNHSSIPQDFRERIEVYRQLRIACDKQGDRFQTLEFHKREMTFYKKFIEIAKPNNWNDLIVLYSGITNDFGQSWIKAFLYAFVFTYILFIPIDLLGSDSFNFNPVDSFLSKLGLSFLKIINHLPKYFELLNPTHNLSNIYKLTNKSGWIYFFDFIHRIITAFFVFQIVSAFRKIIK